MEYKNKIYSLDLKINECISNRQRLLDEYDKVKANTFNENGMKTASFVVYVVKNCL